MEVNSVFIKRGLIKIVDGGSSLKNDDIHSISLTWTNTALTIRI